MKVVSAERRILGSLVGAVVFTAQVDAGGHKIVHVVGDHYEFIAGSNFVNVKGNVNLTIDGNAETYIIDNYSYTGLKGLIAIGIMGVIMSTSDSYLNSAAVLFSNDLCKPLGIKWFTDHQLSLARVSSLIIGIIAYFLAFNTKSILELTFLIWGS